MRCSTHKLLKRVPKIPYCRRLLVWCPNQGPCLSQWCFCSPAHIRIGGRMNLAIIYDVMPKSSLWRAAYCLVPHRKLTWRWSITQFIHSIAAERCWRGGLRLWILHQQHLYNGHVRGMVCGSSSGEINISCWAQLQDLKFVGTLSVLLPRSMPEIYCATTS